MTDLDALRAENVAVWRRDSRLPDYDRKVVDSTSRYLPALEDEVDRLKADLLIANEATLVLTARAAAAEAEVNRLRRVERAARKVHNGPSHYPTHLGGCIGVLSQPSCDCGLGDLSFAVMALDQEDASA